MSMHSDIQTYRRWSAEHYVPLFSRPWWLDAASVGKEWGVVCTQEGAMMPYHVSHRRVLMPQETQCVEPTADEADLADALDGLCRRRHLLYCQMQGYWGEAFRARLAEVGYAVTERVSYRIEAGTRRDEVVAAYSDNKRRQLKRAVGLTMKELSIEQFYAFHRACLGERGRRISYSAAFAGSLLGAAEAHHALRLLGACDAEGRLLAAVGLVYDEHICYYLLPCYSLEHKRSGAMAWLTTEAIVWATESGHVFDFEGSMVPSIARSYREFGGQPAIYFSAEKYYSKIYKITQRGLTLLCNFR